MLTKRPLKAPVQFQSGINLFQVDLLSLIKNYSAPLSKNKINSSEENEDTETVSLSGFILCNEIRDIQKSRKAI